MPNFGEKAVTFDVAAATGWNQASGLSAGNLVVNPGNQTPNASHYSFGNMNQTAGSVTAVTITRNNNASPGGVSNIRYNGNAAVPQTEGTYAVTFDVSAATGWNFASGLSAGNLVVNQGNQTPLASHYSFGNMNQTAGSVTAVTITRNSSASPGAVSNIRYNGNAAVPQTPGTYAVTFDVAAAAGWNFASGLSAGNLVVVENYAWLETKQTTYRVTNGVASPVSSETVTNWITYSYTSDTQYERKYNYATQQNTETSFPGLYTQTQTGSTEGTSHIIRNGQTLVNTTGYTSDLTTTVVYDSPQYQSYNQKTRQATEYESTTMYVYHLETGLTEKQTQVITSTTTSTVNDGTPTVTPLTQNYEILYTIELQNDAGGVKTWKHTTIGTGAYTVNKIQNGVTLERSSYTAGGVLSSIISYDNGRVQQQKTYNTTFGTLSSTTTYTVPDNEVIRANLPNFSELSTNYPSSPASNTHATIELLSDSASALVVRTNVFNADNILMGQTDYRYERIVSR